MPRVPSIVAFVPALALAATSLGIAAEVAAQASSQPQHKIYGFAGNTGDWLFGAPGGDVNADRYPDLVMNARHRVDVYSGKDGRLLHSWSIPHSQNVAPAGDVNRDGHADVLVNVHPGTVHVYSGKDGRVLYSVRSGAPDFGREAMAGLGDLNGDGHHEFGAGSFGGIQSKGHVNVYSGKDGKLMYQVTGTNNGDRVGFVAAAGDINLDKVPDFVACGLKHAGVYSGKDGKLMATVPARYMNMAMWPVHNVGDLNRDGFPDLSIGAIHTHFVSGRWVATARGNVYLGWGLTMAGGSFSGYSTNYNWTVAGVGDQNGDGYADVCAIEIRSREATVFSGKALTSANHQPSSGFDVLGTVGAGTKWTHVSSADVNQDGVMELILSRAWDTSHRLLAGHCEVLSFKKLTLATDTHRVSVSSGGTQKLLLDADTTNRGRNYWVFGSATGTRPGVTLPSPIGSVTLPLVPDVYTDFTIALANTAPWVKTRGTLDANGRAQASIVVPKVPSALGVVLYHAYLVYDPKANFYMASNPTTLLGVR